MAIDRDKQFEAAQKHIDKKKYDKAIVELRKLLAVDPNDVRTLHKVGELQLKQGLVAEALDTFDAVGKLYANGGFAQKAIAVYKQAREIVATQAPHLEERFAHIAPRLAALYQESGFTVDALAVLEDIAKRLARHQKDRELVDVLRRIAELDAKNPLARLRFADALARTGDVGGAARELEAAASLLVESDRRDDAIQVLERLLQLSPDPAQARLCAGLYVSRNRPNDAAQALAKLQICYQANPRDIDTLAIVARAFELIGQTAKALDVHKEMARIARDTGRPDVFRQIVTHLLRVAPHDPAVRGLAEQLGG